MTAGGSLPLEWKGPGGERSMAVSCQPPLREAANAFSTKVLWGEDIFPVSFSKTEWVGYHGGDSKCSPQSVKTPGVGGGNGRFWGSDAKRWAMWCGGLPLHKLSTGFPQRQFYLSVPLLLVGMQAQGILTELRIRDNKYSEPLACLFTFNHDPL